MKFIFYPLLVLFAYYMLVAISFVICEFINLGVEYNGGNFDKDIALLWSDNLIDIFVVFFSWKVLDMLKVKGLLKTSKIPFHTIILIFFFTGLGFLGIDILNDCLSIPDISDDSDYSLGMIVSIVLFGPVFEELIYRGAILGWLLQNSVKPIYAIIYSSVLFGLVHINPTQIFFATIVGVMLGILYWKTRSLVIPILVHITNNSISVLVEDEIDFVDVLGGEFMTCLVIIVCLSLSITFYCHFIKFPTIHLDDNQL